MNRTTVRNPLPAQTQVESPSPPQAVQTHAGIDRLISVGISSSFETLTDSAISKAWSSRILVVAS